MALTRHLTLAIAVALCRTHGAAEQPVPPRTPGPRPETVQAFTRYTRQVESLVDARLRGEEPFLQAASPARLAQLQAGRVLCQPRYQRGDIPVRSGLIHDWVGTVFIPGATVHDVLKVVQDYDRHRLIYRNAVIASRTLEHVDGRYRVYLRLMKRKVTTVILDTEHEVNYQQLDEARWHSRSRSTRIAEVENGGKPGERVLPPGRGHGYLWRLNTYWMFWQKDGGVYLECEVVSLTRNVPAGLAWLLNPIVRNLPRDALIGTLQATRTAVAGGVR